MCRTKPGQERGPNGCRSCRAIGQRYTKSPAESQLTLQIHQMTVTSVRAEGNGTATVSSARRRLRGRDSNPNFLVQSQASCR